MRHMYMRLFSLLLAVLLLMPLGLTGCTSGNPDGTPTDAPETGAESVSPATDAPIGTDTEADIGAGTDTADETAAEAETFADPAPVVKVYPDYKDYETCASEEAPKPEVHRVEGEDYIDATLKGTAMRGPEWSGGACLISNYTPASMEDLWVEYAVTVEQGGVYSLTALCTPSSQGWTCDYFVSVNGNEPETQVRQYLISGSFECPTLNDNGVFKRMSLGTVTLEPGENVIRFTIDPNDPRDAASLGTTTVFFLDWLEVSIGGSTGGASVSVSYDATLSENEKELLSDAANVSVFDCRYPIRLDVSVSGGREETPYRVLDFYGNTVFEGTVPAADGKVTLTRGIADHPTGYFTVRVGSITVPYVVTPPLHTEAYEDSPFAMDFASFYLINNEEMVRNVASVARLIGVTWVRERCNWSDYEKKQGVYDFSATDAVYSTIHSVGLKNLAMLCNSPAWVTTSYKAGAKNVCDGMIGGFRDHQLDAYRMTKAMAQHYDGIVDAWELWNEVDINSFAIEPAELYASWYKAAALGVMDSGVKNTLLSFAGLCQGNNNDYMSLLLQNNVPDYSHIFNYHQHTSYIGNYVTFEYALMKYMNASVPAYTDREMPMWVSESGMKLNFEAGTSEPTEEQLTGQTPYLVTSTVQSLASGTDRHFWFVLAPYIEVGGDFGTFSGTYEPYPTVAAEAVMTNELGRGLYIGRPDGIPSSCDGALFDTGRGMTAVLWATNYRKNSYDYTFESAYPVVVTDMMGSRQTVQPVDGKVTVSVGQYPCYVTYKTAPAYTPQSYAACEYADLTVAESGRVILTPLFDTVDLSNDKNGGHVIDVNGSGYELRVRVLNLNDREVTGSISGSCPGMTVTGADGITVPAMGEVTVTVLISHDGDGAFDCYLTLTGSFGSDGGTSVSVSRIVGELSARTGDITFKYPRRDGQSFDDGCKSVTAEFKNVTGTVGVWINGEAYTAFTVEESGNGGTVTIDTSTLGKGRYFVSVGVMPAGGEYRFNWITFVNE